MTLHDVEIRDSLIHEHQKRIAELEAEVELQKAVVRNGAIAWEEAIAERDRYKKTLRDAYNSTASWGCGSCIRIRATIREALNKADTK